MNDTKRLVVEWLSKYFPTGSQKYIFKLPILQSDKPLNSKLDKVLLPEWAQDLSPNNGGYLIVPAHCIIDSKGEKWRNTDWFRAVFDMITSQSEREFEDINGAIHSYSYKLDKVLYPMFEHAWVNRIALFLRRWSSRHSSVLEMEIFGNKPKGKIYLSHDVDYIKKTLALRFKQSIFNTYNIVQALLKRDLNTALNRTSKLFIFSLGKGDYWQFEKIKDLEKKNNVISYWNFYGARGGFFRSISKHILDPSYDIQSAKLKKIVKTLKNEGHEIGLHPAFHSWNNYDSLNTEKHSVEATLEKKVTSCRQHWLRFSFKETWRNQELAGFLLDSTLGFNDRVGFRNGAALKTPAWDNVQKKASSSLKCLPMVLMDSHLFDYNNMSKSERRGIIDKIVEEIAFTGGEASIIWHQRVFHSDYGWGDDYEYLLNKITLEEVS